MQNKTPAALVGATGVFGDRDLEGGQRPQVM